MIDEGLELEELMQEPPGGENHGRLNGVSMNGGVGFDMRLGAGYHIVDRHHGGVRGNPGGNVLHPVEYVDPAVLSVQVEEEFGFTKAEVHSVYTVKKLRHDQRRLRDAIDARVLALSRSGGNMALLARVLEVNPRTMERALARARGAAQEA